MPGTNTRHRLLHSLNLEHAFFFLRRFKLFLGQCTEDTNCLCRAFKVRKWNKCLPCSDFQPLFVLNPLCVSWVELGTRQFFSFSTTTTRQRNRASVTSKIQKNVKALMSKKSGHNEERQTGYCNYQLFLDLKMCTLTLSRQCCRVPSSDSGIFSPLPSWWQFIHSLQPYTSQEETCCDTLVIYY